VGNTLNQYIQEVSIMSEKGLFASICGFFKGLFSSDSEQSSAAATSDGLTGVERYIRNQANSTSQLTGVERYIQNQANTPALTGVARYILNQASAPALTGVEKYIRDNS